MLFTGMQEQIVELGWDFYLPVMLFVCLIALVELGFDFQFHSGKSLPGFRCGQPSVRAHRVEFNALPFNQQLYYSCGVRMLLFFCERLLWLLT